MAIKARIVIIDAPPMSTIWSFTAIDTEGKTHVFHADWRQGRDLCDGLADQARREAQELAIQIPQGIAPGILVCAMDIELLPSESMGALMPDINPVGLNVEFLQSAITQFEARS